MQFEVYKARPADARDIANLYKIVYEGKYSLEEYMDADFIAKHVNDDNLIWRVARDNGTLVGSTVGTIDSVHKTCELGRTAVNILSSGRGCARELCQSMKMGVLEKDVDVVWGTMRNLAMLRIAERLGLSVAGYTGVHVPDRRELQLMGVEVLERAQYKRVVPMEGLPIAGLESVLGNGADNELMRGEYARHVVVPPQQGSTFLLSGFYHASDDCLRVSSYEDVLRVPECVQAVVLADKKHQIRDAMKSGFQLAGYLPAWFLEGDKRYDCVVLEKYWREPKLGDEAFKPIIADLKKRFSWPDSQGKSGSSQG